MQVTTTSESPRLLAFLSRCSDLFCSFCGLQGATFLAVYPHIEFAGVKGIGWGWAGVIWLYSFISYIPLDIIKFAVRYILSGKPWDLLLERKVRVAHIANTVLSHSNPCKGRALTTNSLFSAGCVYKEERLWQRIKGGSVGASAKNSAWSASRT